MHTFFSGKNIIKIFNLFKTLI